MRKLLFVVCMTLFALPLFATESGTKSVLDSLWHSFRTEHPFGYQTVGKGHYGDECLFIISEPPESVSQKAIEDLFLKYGGSSEVKRVEFGFDGWLSDVVGHIRFKTSSQESTFTHDLFTLLYGTDYKASYTDLDHLERHVYYSPYELNYSISAADLSAWFMEDNELLQDAAGTRKNIKAWLSTSLQESNKLLLSQERGFVVWLINTRKISPDDKLFRTNARRFALDADLIIGAFGKKGGNVAVIAREREVPVSVLPPLRIETLTLLATTLNQHLGQSYDPDYVFSGKMKGNKDFAVIYLSDELWHTEYGNLLNMADQMLKCWSENGKVDYHAFDYPKPIDWAFKNGAFKELGKSVLVYNWNTRGAGYVVEGDDGWDVFSINRTGSLPVSFFPDGMEGEMPDGVYDAEDLAYDFFSQLNNPELVRVVQYAAFYQILTHFKGVYGNTQTSKKDNSLPDYSVFEPYVETLLRFVGQSSDIYQTELYQKGLARFKERYKEVNDVSDLFEEYVANDPYGGFVSFVEDILEEEELLSLTSWWNVDLEAERLFKEYVDTNVAIIKQYIEDYQQWYGEFPYSEAARYIVSPRETSILIAQLEPYNKRKDRLYALMASGTQQFALGALNWLLTDPAPYDEPLGAFFSSKLTGHKRWIKTPVMVCSTYWGQLGYGGHNLDAHVTPVRVASDVPNGKCRVSFQNGNRVFSVAKADRKRITPEVLRKVERQVAQDNTYINLPPEPSAQSKGVLISDVPRTERGFDVSINGKSRSVERSAKVGDVEVTTVDELVKAEVAETSSGQAASKEIRIKRYSEREALVEMDGQQYVLDRSEVKTVDFRDLNPTIKEDVRGSDGVLILSQDPATIGTQGYKAANVEIVCPRENLPALKQSVRTIMDNRSIDVDNLFKIRRNIEIEMRQTIPNFNSKDIQLEEVIFSDMIMDKYYYYGEQFYTRADAA